MKTKLFTLIALVGILTPLISVQTAFAWHPVGVVTKSVQNQTTGGALQDANDTTHAVSAKTGDILRYVIEVRNDGTADSRGYNDLASVVITDTLPQGEQLVSDPTATKVTFNLATIKPQAKLTKEYLVKVTETKDAKLIENKACFTGNSTVNDNPQSGCDVADVVTKQSLVINPVIIVPTPVSTPTDPASTTPTATPLVQSATTIPNTGPGNVIALAIAASLLGYFGSRLVLSKHAR